jgi:hypothetical protein
VKHPDGTVSFEPPYDYWSGVTESGKRQTVKCPHYTDHDWHRAYLSLVRGQLVQAIGRGRGILPEGIPVYVVTRENLAPPADDIDARNGFPLADEGRLGPLTEAEANVLAAMHDLRRPIVRTEEIASAMGVSTRRVRLLLSQLESSGRVIRRGTKGGWGRVQDRNSAL